MKNGERVSQDETVTRIGAARNAFRVNYRRANGWEGQTAMTIEASNPAAAMARVRERMPYGEEVLAVTMLTHNHNP